MPYNRAILRELLAAAFSDSDLKTFCSDHFADVYNNFTDEQGRDDRILDLLDYVEKRSNFQDLAALIKTANPERYKDFEARLTAEVERGAGDPDITDALKKIQDELNRNPDYDYLKRRFAAILERITLLSNYKVLHNGLHEIQYSYYQNIIASTKIVLDDKYAKTDLKRYLRDYRRVVAEMQDAASQKKVDDEEHTWIAQLEQAGNDLEEGIAKGSKTQINSATQSINLIIGTRPTVVNRKLYAAVYAYKENLPEPTDLMEKVRTRINAIAPDSDKAKRFQNGIDSLKEINTKLGELISEHNTWQDVDRELRSLPDLLADAGIPPFKRRWEREREKIQSFYLNSADKSSVRLKEAQETLDAAVASNVQEEVLREFENYCSEASDRFFYVDKSVLELCERLRMIRNQLD